MYLLRRIIAGLVVPVALLTAACGGSNNSPTAPSGPAPTGPATLQTTDLTVGTGAAVVTNKVVTVTYVLWRYDPSGTDSKGEGLEQNAFSFRTGTSAVIPGFEQIVLGMNVGGARRGIVPPNLAYGATGNGNIRPNEWLVFEIAVISMSD
jgi:FKBP-type peptidyl-prolyl cis-trans isomerase